MIFRMVPESQCSVNIRLDAPVIDEGEENINARKEELDALLINLRQVATKEVCCSAKDIIEVPDYDDDENEVEITCDELDGTE